MSLQVQNGNRIREPGHLPGSGGMDGRHPGRTILEHLRWALIVLAPRGQVRRRLAQWRRSLAHHLPPEAQDVVDAASILEISEYDLLALAYEERFGRKPRPVELGRVFTPYMLDGETPEWGTALAREIIGLYERGELPESRFAIMLRPPATWREWLSGILESLLVLGVLWLIYYAFATYQP